MDDRLEELRAQLDSMIERVDEISFEILQQAAAEGETERPDLDRQLIRVRRALERARSILSPF